MWATPPRTFSISFAVEARAPRPSTLPDSAISPELEKVVLKMLAPTRRQEDRYATPAELLEDLEPIGEKLGVEV